MMKIEIGGEWYEGPLWELMSKIKDDLQMVIDPLVNLPLMQALSHTEGAIEVVLSKYVKMKAVIRFRYERHEASRQFKIFIEPYGTKKPVASMTVKWEETKFKPGDIAGSMTPEQRKADREMRWHFERRFLAQEFAKFIAFSLGAFRKHHKITQEELADAVGSNKTAISRYENGRDDGMTLKRVMELWLSLEHLRQHTCKERR